MAKKSTSKGSRSSKSAAARPASAAKRGAKAASKRPAAKARTKTKPAAKPKTASRAKATAKPAAAAKPAARKKPAAKRTSGARAKAAAAAPKRALKDRQQPETLRCKSLSVALTCDDVAASLRFYVDGMGFHVKQRWEKDGELLGAELVAGACMLGVSQDDWAKGRDRTKGIGMSIYAESTQGVDALAERLRAAGIDFKGPESTEWGWRQVSAVDPDGFRLIVYDETKS